jgi:insertion element IS1 protein InsB
VLQADWLTGSAAVVTGSLSNGSDPRLYCTDDWAAYQEAIPQGRLYVGKDQTHGLERDHAWQRHWLARFRRRSIVVSKARRMVDTSIALFARFGGNDRIGELAAMLA